MVGSSARRVADETPAPPGRGCPCLPPSAAPSATPPARPARRGRQPEALMACFGWDGCDSAPLPRRWGSHRGRLQPRGRHTDERPRIAAVIGADGRAPPRGRGPRPRVTIDHPAKARPCPAAGVGMHCPREAVAAARGGVRPPAPRGRPPVLPAGATGWPTYAPMAALRTSRATLPRSRRPNQDPPSAALPRGHRCGVG